MSITLTADIIHSTADRLLSSGEPPSVEAICRQLGIERPDGSLEQELQVWWGSLAGRVMLMPEGDNDTPDAMVRAVRLIWQDAVREAAGRLSTEQQSLDSSVRALKEESEELLGRSRAEYEDLEVRLSREALRAEEAENQLKVVEAEITVLRSTLAGEVALRKQTEEKLQDGRNEIKRGAQALEDARRTFDGRLKDEQTHGQELLAKAEVELRHYKSSLEAVRDEAGKKESVLTRNLHDIQTEIARRDVRIETLQGQVKSLEGELKGMRSDTGAQSMRLSQANAKLLSESNKNKRLEERAKQLEADLKNEKQRVSLSSGEAMRKEADLRQSLKVRDDELQKVKGSVSGLQKKLIAQEEQIRRLQAQARS